MRVHRDRQRTAPIIDRRTIFAIGLPTPSELLFMMTVTSAPAMMIVSAVAAYVARRGKIRRNAPTNWTDGSRASARSSCGVER